MISESKLQIHKDATRISVIMGIYNCASTLREALDSLLNQTFQGFKVIMCDDGSSDHTIEIAKEYVTRYPDKFILIKNASNLGLNQTLNNCLKHVDTEYTARMDGDDISLPNRFEEEINFLDNHPEFQIVSTPMIYFDEKGEFKRGIGGFEPSHARCAVGTPFCHAPCMVRTEAYRAVGGYSVDKKLLRCEDYHLWVKMFAKGYRGFMLETPLYKMRDDRAAKRRRNFKGKIHVMNVQRFAIKTLNLPKWKYIYCLRPILVGLLPSFIYNYLHRK